MRVPGLLAMTIYSFVLLGAALVNNVLLARILGLCDSMDIAGIRQDTFKQ